MLYKYPVRQDKTAYETIRGSKRYDTYTGEELPPIPYVNTTKEVHKKTTAASSGGYTNGGASSGGGYTSGAASSAVTAPQADVQKDLLQQKMAQLDNYYATNRTKLAQYYDAQQKAAKMSNDDILRQLYIAYMQGIKNMPQQSALWGAGGEIESLKSRHRTNYESNRAKQNAQYSGIVSEIQQKYNKDLMELEEKYLKQLMSL